MDNIYTPINRFDIHVFVCENRRPEGHPRGCCASKNSVEFRDTLKKKAKAAGLNSRVRVNSAGCLDACEFGVTMVVYPEGVWYGGLTVEDIDELIESHFRQGVPVQRLLIKDKRFAEEAHE
jgi:(2Fe-2S) ferredoxin